MDSKERRRRSTLSSRTNCSRKSSPLVRPSLPFVRTRLTNTMTVPLSTLVTASLPPAADATPNPKNPTLFNGVKRFFVVHGGLFSREDVLLSEIKSIDRMKQRQPGHDGLMCEMLWTDPQDASGRGPSKRVRLPTFPSTLHRLPWSKRRVRRLTRLIEGCRNWFRTRRDAEMDGEE